MSIVTTLLALLIEAVAGYPESIFRRIGHPVVWIGRLIGWCGRALNREGWSGAHRKLAGFVSLFIFVGIPTTLALGLEHVLGLAPLGVLLVAVLASTLLAQRSLYMHVERVADALEQGGLAAGRIAVSQIVGRDPNALD